MVAGYGESEISWSLDEFEVWEVLGYDGGRAIGGMVVDDYDACCLGEGSLEVG